MLSILTLAGKDLRLLLRDARSGVILLLMPLLFMMVLGLAVGEGFGLKPDDRLRISVVLEDEGLPPGLGDFPGRPWSEIFLEDLSQAAGIRIEVIPTRAMAEDLLRQGKRAAVLVFEKDFSVKVHACSFLSKTEPPELPPLNPLYRDGINVAELGLTIRRDPTQQVASSIIEQVAQVSMLRVVIPWMIGRAFEQVGKSLGPLAKIAISRLFNRYNFEAKTWTGLTKAEPRPKNSENITVLEESEPGGVLNRGAVRYQILVPSYTVMFSFFLVLTCGWLFVAERKNGTLIRLRAAPLSRASILLGKLIPCLILSIFQGGFLLVAGKLVFGMSWGPQALWLIPVVISTSLAAMGMAMLIAGVARTETQVAVYGTLLVLVLAGISGSMMPRDLMPEEIRRLSYITPHAWALDAYAQLLTSPTPSISVVLTSCLVLSGFGLGFLVLAWLLIRLD